MEKDSGIPMSIHQMPMMIVIFTLLLKLFLLLFLVNPKSKEKDTDSYQSVKFNPYHLISNTMRKLPHQILYLLKSYYFVDTRTASSYIIHWN